MFFSFLFMLPTWYNYTCTCTYFFVLKYTWHASNPKLHGNIDGYFSVSISVDIKATKYQPQRYSYSKIKAPQRSGHACAERYQSTWFVSLVCSGWKPRY